MQSPTRGSDGQAGTVPWAGTLAGAGAGRMGQGSVREPGHYPCGYAEPVPPFEQLLMPKRDHPVPTSGSPRGRVLVQTATSLPGTSGPIWGVEGHHPAWPQIRAQLLLSA